MNNAGNSSNEKVVALCGGVGGAKLAWGLAQILSPDQLTIIVNTGDDFEHLGLHISPDLDTVMYTLAGLAHRELGWGLQGESWHCMEALQQLGGETWFRLGDKDLATHFFRTRQLTAGKTLTEVTTQLCRTLGVQHHILPMCNEPLPTFVDTDEGTLPFQHYFVRAQCRPTVRSVQYHNRINARMSDEVIAALGDKNVTRIIMCPSNPLLSIAPILAVPGMRETLQSLRKKIAVVSPLVGGRAVKGPTAKIMQDLGFSCDSQGILDFYADLAGHLVIDTCDTNDFTPMKNAGSTIISITRTLMRNEADKITLAQHLLSRTIHDSIAGGQGKC